MELLFQQLIDQAARANDLSQKQQQTILVQQSILKKQQEQMEVMMIRMERIENLQLQMAEILDRELLSILDQPLLFKQDVMEKLGIGDSTYRAYVSEDKLRPMSLGKIDYYFARDLAKALLTTKYRRKC